ncbi:hypothetical protein EIP91_007034 [Steccherinum ochraceum]|uniref:Phytase-like domain-containing protein n=1 Tax=Steccherinum ochraceum TaxID=92696 RepID=A0A4R0RM15_9APHY|nr:hypothetical protein EIP91_007034 [Steccherinum ochraceum]
MARIASVITILFAGASLVAGAPTTSNHGSSPATEPDPKLAVSVKLNGATFVNKGLVGFGLIPSDFVESTGDSLGGIGSAIALKPGSFKKNRDGTFSGTVITQPDRGFNVDNTIDYQGRQHAIDFVLSPYYGDNNLTFADAQKTLALTYKSTFRYSERNNVPTTGLDALGVRAAQSGFSRDPLADPQLPIANATFPRLSLDLEGLVLNKDGSFWISDEYGPYVYRFDSTGRLVQTIQPPQAILPHNAQGELSFDSENDPATGRVGNQGFECLTVDSAGTTLYVMLQSATVQDGGDDKSTSRFTRLLAYDISSPSKIRPKLKGEWVVPLPQNSKGNTLAASEIHFISRNTFFVLARDGDGHGGDDNNSAYKQADLIDISKATNIANSKFDSPQFPIAKNGTLDRSINPATYVGFVNFIDDTQLARFGLHNGKPADATLIDAKWESLALAPVGDSKFPHDFFLFTAADNDFMSTNGIFDGVSFNAGLDNDNQFLVFRVTLPTVTAASLV